MYKTDILLCKHYKLNVHSWRSFFKICYTVFVLFSTVNTLYSTWIAQDSSYKCLLVRILVTKHIYNYFLQYLYSCSSHINGKGLWLNVCLDDVMSLGPKNLKNLQAPLNIMECAWFCIHFCDHKCHKILMNIVLVKMKDTTLAATYWIFPVKVTEVTWLIGLFW